LGKLQNFQLNHLLFAFLVAARFADPIVSLPPYQFAKDKFLWRIRKELHGKKEKLLIDLAINDLIHRPQVIGKLGSLSYSGGHAE